MVAAGGVLWGFSGTWPWRAQLQDVQHREKLPVHQENASTLLAVGWSPVMLILLFLYFEKPATTRAEIASWVMLLY